MILSTALAAHAGVDLSYLPMAKASVRGKAESLRVYLVRSLLEDLPRAIPKES
jgi:hypothetical protein